jgi:hypothetical protein
MHGEPLNRRRLCCVIVAAMVPATSRLSRAPAGTDDWRDAAKAAQPPPAFVEVLLQVGSSDLNAAGYDMGSGAWYRFVGGRAWGHVPGVGSFESRGGGVPPRVGPGPRRDQFVERMVFPFVTMGKVLADPAQVIDAVWHDDGWTLTVREGEGEGDSFVIRLGGDGRIDAVGSPQSPDPLTYPPGAPEQYPIGALRGLPVEVTILQAHIRPAGSPAAPALTLQAADGRFRMLFARQSDLKRNVAEARARETPRLAPGEERPDGSGSARSTSILRYGPAVIFAGAVVLVLALAAWWKNRGG